MWRLIFYFAMVTVAALGFAWLADRPGTVNIEWQGTTMHMSLMTMLIGLITLITAVMAVWWLIKNLLIAPGRLSRNLRQKSREKGFDAVSRGLIAVSAGDAALARKLAGKAGRKLQSDPLATLLKAQAAQLAGDRAEARRLFEAMLESPETEAAGLRGLYLEARREKEIEAARQFADKAVRRNPQLGWSTQALLEIQSRAGQWTEALKTLDLARKHKMIDKKTAERQRAVLLTAQALELEEHDADAALTHALDAHRLAPDLVPAANVAGRILAGQGNVRRAASVLLATWDRAPHPDLALTYAFVRPGDSPRDRLTRVQQLAERTPYDMEGPIAVATAAIESHDWKEARAALKSLLADRPTARVCTLMARIEGSEFGDKGRVREWLARAVRAPRDPVWTADGYVSDHWAPVSPITGKLDAFGWKVPVEGLEYKDDGSFDSFVPLAADESDEEAPTATAEAPRVVDVTPTAVGAPKPAAAIPPAPPATQPAAPSPRPAARTEPAPAVIDAPVVIEATPVPVAAKPEPVVAPAPKAEAAPAPVVSPSPLTGTTAMAEATPAPLPAPAPAAPVAPAAVKTAAAPAAAAQGATSTPPKKPAMVEIVRAEPVDEPLAFEAVTPGPVSEVAADTADAAPVIVPAEARGAGEPGKKTEARPGPDIYIPPRRPDDPGPLDTDPHPATPKLPQRFRQSN